MQISVTWVTPREYSADIDTAELLGRVTGTAHEPEARRLLSQIEAGGTLDDDDMTQLAAVIGQHTALLPEGDENWTSTGETEVTHVEGIRAGG
jgi:hypothetical protein